jgi:hypothetical protein
MGAAVKTAASCAVIGGLRAALTEAVRTAASCAVIGRGLRAAVTEGEQSPSR